MSSKITTPYPLFNDVDGRPLDAGFVYIGEAGKNPEIYPTPVYWDENLTVPAQQPIRTRNGYFSKNGRAGKLYVADADCSITAKNKNKIVVHTDLFADLFFGQKDVVKTVETIANLKYLLPWAGRTVFVQEMNANYVYSENAGQNLGKVIVNGWVMSLQDKYYASWFATPNTKVAQDELLQAGHNYTTSKNRTLIIDGAFWVDATKAHSSNTNYGALYLKSNSKTIFLPNTSINVLDNSATNYNVVVCSRNVENIVVINPTLIGDRLNHTYTAGSTHEWGYGMVVYESKNVFIQNLRAFDMTGDGLYIGKEWDSILKTVPTDIIISNPLVDRVRRNAISFTAGDNVKILNPTVCNVTKIGNIDAVAPKAGVDIEPEESDYSRSQGAIGYIRNSQVDNLTMINCGYGLVLAIFKDKRECSLSFTGTTTAINSKMLTIYNHVDTPDAQSGQKGLIVIENYVVNPGSPTEISDIGLREYGIKVIVKQLTYSDNVNQVVHQLISEGTIFNAYTKQIGGLVFENIATNGQINFQIGRYFLGTDEARTQAKPNLFYNWVTPPNMQTNYDYDFGKSYGDKFKNNAVFSGDTQGYFNANTFGADSVILNPASDGTAVTNPPIGREMTFKLGDGAATYGLVTGLGGDTVIVNNDGSMTKKGSLKIAGIGSWVKLKKVSNTKTQILASYGSIQPW